MKLKLLLGIVVGINLVSINDTFANEGCDPDQDHGCMEINPDPDNPSFGGHGSTGGSGGGSFGGYGNSGGSDGGSGGNGGNGSGDDPNDTPPNEDGKVDGVFEMGQCNCRGNASYASRAEEHAQNNQLPHGTYQYIFINNLGETWEIELQATANGYWADPQTASIIPSSGSLTPSL